MMPSKRIDKLEQLDLPNLKAADLKYCHGTGQAVTTGSGRDKRYSYRSGIQTPIGDIELSVWIQAAEFIVARDGLEQELKQLRPFMPKLSLDTPSARKSEHADHLDACLSELYRDPAWVHYVPYNRKYHPELLDAVPMIHVITDCCQEVGLVPAAQVHPPGSATTVPCPFCGRFSTFRRAESTNSHNGNGGNQN